LLVRPTGRDSGISARKTLTKRVIGAEHVVVIGDAPEGESK
jgi:predicted SpoU family rRNA methylase